MPPPTCNGRQPQRPRRKIGSRTKDDLLTWLAAGFCRDLNHGGHVMSVVIDDDSEGRRFDGELGVQVHVGPPMKIEYRNFRLKNL